MMKRLGSLLLPPVILFFVTGLGCSNKKEEKPIPELPKDGLKGFTPKSTGSPKVVIPSQ